MNSPAWEPSGPRSPEPGAGLPREHDRVLVAQLVQVQLVLGLEGADRLVRGDLRAQRPHQGGLAGALGAGDDDGLAGLDRGGQERRGNVGQGAEPDQVLQGDAAQPVAADHHGRAGRHPRRRGQAGAAVQAQVQPGLGLGEGSGVDLAAGGQEDEEVDELGVAVRDGRAGDQPSVAQLEGDLVVAGDDDVLHHLVVHQRLEPAEPEQGVVDRGHQRVLLRG